MKIILEKSKCIGCGSCSALCAEIFELEEDGKAHLKGSKMNPETKAEELKVNDVACAKDAVDVCPAQCIYTK